MVTFFVASQNILTYLNEAMFPYHSAILPAVLASAWILFGSITAAEPPSGGDLIGRIETQLAAIERLLPSLRHVAVTTEQGSESKARVSSEAWFVPGDAVETPVKVVLMEQEGQERRETAFWLDQGRLFFVRERIETYSTSGSEATERHRSYDGFHLFPVGVAKCHVRHWSTPRPVFPAFRQARTASGRRNRRQFARRNCTRNRLRTGTGGDLQPARALGVSGMPRPHRNRTSRQSIAVPEKTNSASKCRPLSISRSQWRSSAHISSNGMSSTGNQRGAASRVSEGTPW